MCQTADGQHHHHHWSEKSLHRHAGEYQPLRIGVGGPVGSGKTALVERLTRELASRYSIGVVTNDIYTKEDALFLMEHGVLERERIIGVETGGCPHTAVREDASMNLEAIDDLKERYEDLDLVFVESGGDNLAAAFSPELVDVFIYIIDVAQGEKIPRKGGPGIMQSDMLVINKTDLAPHVGASLDVMRHDSEHMRGDRPFVFTNLRQGDSVLSVVDYLEGRIAQWRATVV